MTTPTPDTFTVRQLDDIVYQGLVFKHFEVKDACFIHEIPFHVFSWKKGCNCSPHYKAYAYSAKDNDYTDEDVLIQATGIDQDNLENAAKEAVEGCFYVSIYDYNLTQLHELNDQELGMPTE